MNRNSMTFDDHLDMLRRHLAEARTIKTLRELRSNRKLWSWAYRYGYQKLFKAHLHQKPKKDAWTEAELKKIISKYEWLSDLRRERPDVWSTCKNRWSYLLKHLKRQTHNLERELYVISCKETREIYVGLTVCMEKRNHRRPKIAELKARGVYKRLAPHMPEDQAAELEKQWIEKLHANPNWKCLNSTHAGGSLGGCRIR